MAHSRVMPENHYHVRSTSMPSRSHPLALRVEDQLSKLRACETSSSPSSLLSIKRPTMKILCDRLSGLRDLCDCVNDLIQSPLTQQALVHDRRDKWVDEMLDGSLGVLDVCSIASDAFMQMKEHVLDIQSALRRRRGSRDQEIGNKVGVYVSLRKKMKKEIDRSLRPIKRTESKFTLSPIIGDDQHLGDVIILVREVRSITIFIFESLLSFMVMSRPVTKKVGWSLVSKWFSLQQVACEEEGMKMNDFERVDASLQALSSFKDVDSEWVQNAQKGLEALDMNIQDVENRLDCVFRCLIKTRVSLLNNLNS